VGRRVVQPRDQGTLGLTPHCASPTQRAHLSRARLQVAMGGLSLLCSKVPRYAPAHLTLTFHLADYFRSRGVSLPQPAFVEQATIRLALPVPTSTTTSPCLPGRLVWGALTAAFIKSSGGSRPRSDGTNRLPRRQRASGTTRSGNIGAQPTRAASSRKAASRVRPRDRGRLHAPLSG
jgi:hypothetical protein